MSNSLSLLLVAALALYCVQLCSGLAHLVMVYDALKDGAMCLDGTVPGYYHRKGYGSGAKKWIMHLEGGGWCVTEEECYKRSKTNLGSTKGHPETRTFGGLLSANETVNPDFYNWNMVYVIYCDGASFLGNANNPVDIDGTAIFFRGFRILQGVLKSLEIIGSMEAEDFILTGCSAGGISTYIHADYVRTQLSPTTKYAAIADAGFMINAPSLYLGIHIMKIGSDLIFRLHNASEALDHDCIRGYPGKKWKCILAPYNYPYISSPMFSVNSIYDTWQLANILLLECLPPHCNAEQLATLENYGKEFLEAAKDVINSESNGEWFDSCFQHCQTIDDTTLNKVKVDGQTISETIRYWYNKSGGKTKVVDCAYPCNHSC